jgi:DNA-binding response OmpR family regulator
MTARGYMSERKELFVLVVAADRVIAATLATVLHAGGYMAASTASGATALRIAGRMVVDAAVMDLGTNRPLGFETAVALQGKYPDCRIILVCSPSQLDEVAMLVEETGLNCELVIRPLSCADLLAKLVAAPGVRSPETSRRQLESSVAFP